MASGHRAYLEEEVEEYVTKFLGGQDLQTILKKPMLRTWAGSPVMCKDGLRKLLDGKKATEAGYEKERKSDSSFGLTSRQVERGQATVVRSAPVPEEELVAVRSGRELA